jgi:hypothetical protein
MANKPDAGSPLDVFVRQKHRHRRLSQNGGVKAQQAMLADEDRVGDGIVVARPGEKGWLYLGPRE